MENNSSGMLPKRDNIDPKFKWRLEDIYENDQLWENDLKLAKELKIKVSEYKGKLSNSADSLYECLQNADNLLSKCDKIFVFAKMRKDEDNGNGKYQAYADRAMSLVNEVYASVSFIVPEILDLSEEKLNEFKKSKKELALYNQYFNEILRQKEHILPAREEELLAMTAEISGASKEIFNMFNNADIRFGTIKDEKGNEIEVTKGRYTLLLENPDRRVRKDAFNALYKSYIDHRNTLASTLINNVKKNKFYTQVRKYKSTLERALDDDNVKVQVYDNLIKTVSDNISLLHRYLRLRKKALRLNELHMYDLYVPIVSETNRKVSYEEAVSTVKLGLAPLGSQYIMDLENGIKSGWIDVYENQGKTSGAYSWGCYESHPFVLLNFQGTTNDIFTLAHEMGHAMHSYYTNRTQSYIYSEYKIFVAEVASTVNETLLMQYMLKENTDKKQRAYLLNHYLEEFRGTVFRQTMFAEFEKAIHGKIESGEALTADSLCKIYRDLNIKYFGAETIIDSEIDMEWSRIPHFYNSFYVYKYSTGFSAAASLANGILNEGQSAVNKYLEFLSSGSSDYPLNLLNKAGIDLTTPKPIMDALGIFERVLTELESLV